MTNATQRAACTALRANSRPSAAITMSGPRIQKMTASPVEVIATLRSTRTGALTAPVWTTPPASSVGEAPRVPVLPSPTASSLTSPAVPVSSSF
jgi:hypothetical protein